MSGFRAKNSSLRTQNVPLQRKRYGTFCLIKKVLSNIPLPRNFTKMVLPISMPASYYQAVLVPRICVGLTLLAFIRTSRPFRRTQISRRRQSMSARMVTLSRMLKSHLARSRLSFKPFSITPEVLPKILSVKILELWASIGTFSNSGYVSCVQSFTSQGLSCYLRDEMIYSPVRLTVVKLILVVLTSVCIFSPKKFQETTIFLGSMLKQTSYFATNTQASYRFSNLIDSVMDAPNLTLKAAQLISHTLKLSLSPISPGKSSIH